MRVKILLNGECEKSYWRIPNEYAQRNKPALRSGKP